MKREIHQCECAQQELICLSPQVLGDCKVDKVVLTWFSTISIPFFFSYGFCIVFIFFLFQAQSSHPCILFFTLLFPKAFTMLQPSSSQYSYADLQPLSLPMTLLTFTGQKSAFSHQVMQPFPTPPTPE